VFVVGDLIVVEVEVVIGRVMVNDVNFNLQ
jgi:hypothetical protein